MTKIWIQLLYPIEKLNQNKTHFDHQNKRKAVLHVMKINMKYIYVF